MTLKIRTAVEADAEAIARVSILGWQQSYRGQLPDAMLDGLQLAPRTQAWQRILQANAADCLVVAGAQGIVGFGHCGPQRTPALVEQGYTGEITAIYLLDAIKRQGLGRELMQRMAHLLAASGHAAAALWVLDTNVAARAFYARMGGKPISERSDERPNITLHEVAYGWPDITALY